jgi:hypothetical protein
MGALTRIELSSSLGDILAQGINLKNYNRCL